MTETTSPTSTADSSSAAKKERINGYVGLAFRLVLGGVMLWAGLSKITNLQGSVNAVRAYQLPDWLFWSTQPIGYALPIIETIIGILLIAGLFTRFSAIVTGILMFAFVIGIASAWARGLSIDCGCFGGGGEIDESETRYPQELARDMALLGMAVWLSVKPKTPWSVDEWLFAQPDDIDAVHDEHGPSSGTTSTDALEALDLLSESPSHGNDSSSRS